MTQNTASLICDSRGSERVNQEFKDQIKYYFQKFINRFKQTCATRNNQAIHRSLLNLFHGYKIENCRPVISMVDSPEYKLAKFLDTVIKPYISDKYMLRSSYEFLEKLQEVNLNSNQVMVSFDVKSLFTNVPLQEAIDLISGKIYENNSDVIQLPIIKILLNLATKGIFLYKDQSFQQIDGVSMGLPLGPTTANFFLAEMETCLLQQQLDSIPKVYFRYADDIFAIFINKQTVWNF